MCQQVFAHHANNIVTIVQMEHIVSNVQEQAKCSQIILANPVVTNNNIISTILAVIVMFHVRHV